MREELKDIIIVNYKEMRRVRGAQLMCNRRERERESE